MPRSLRSGLTGCLLLLLAACGWLAAPAAARTTRPDARSRPGRAAQAGDARPNIVVVVVDDLGAIDGRMWAYLPHLNALRAAGVTFDDFHAESPLCCPARAGFLTGQHTHNHGVYTNDAALFDPSMTIATQLHGAGYYTIGVGKYFNMDTTPHAFTLRTPIPPPGWDSFTAMGHPPDYYNYRLLSTMPALAKPVSKGGVIDTATFKPCTRNTGQTSPTVAVVCTFGKGTTVTQRTRNYSTGNLAKIAVASIAQAPATEPLFLWFAPNAPHVSASGGGIVPAPQYASDPSCQTIPPWDDPAYDQTDPAKPAYVRDAPPLADPNGYDLVATCEAMRSVDDAVAQITGALQSAGRLANTLLLFFGDNGENYGDHRLTSKYSPYHTDIPAFASWPALQDTPLDIADRLQNIDLAPTLCELAGFAGYDPTTGAPTFDPAEQCQMGPYPNGQATPDGTSFAGELLGTQRTLGRGDVLDELPTTSPQIDNPPWEAVTTTADSPHAYEDCAAAASGGCRWHYVEYANGERELYDLSGGPCWLWTPGAPGDPCELDNLVDPETGVPFDPGYQPLVDALHAELAALEQQGRPVLPVGG